LRGLPPLRGVVADAVWPCSPAVLNSTRSRVAALLARQAWRLKTVKLVLCPLRASAPARPAANHGRERSPVARPHDSASR
jgi:hypothetical protein